MDEACLRTSTEGMEVPGGVREYSESMPSHIFFLSIMYGNCVVVKPIVNSHFFLIYVIQLIDEND